MPLTNYACKMYLCSTEYLMVSSMEAMLSRQEMPFVKAFVSLCALMLGVRQCWDRQAWDKVKCERPAPPWILLQCLVHERGVSSSGALVSEKNLLPRQTLKRLANAE